MTQRAATPRRGNLLGAAALALLLGVTGPARPDPPALPLQQQGQINLAIDRGVFYLLQTQTRYTQGHFGTWARKERHMVGYTALPSLTLLECGVSPKDDKVVRAANFVRRYTGKLDQTYDIALTILFLDRLGDPKDKVVIQRLALRLVAGQGPTGGWGYRCPVLDTETHKQLLTVLRQLEPPVLFNPLNTPRPGLNEPIAGLGSRTGEPLTTPSQSSPGDQESPADPQPGAKPGRLDPLSGGSSLASPLRSPDEQPATPLAPGVLPPADGAAPGGAPAGDAGAGGSAGAAPERTFRRWGWCLKMQDPPPESAPRKPGPVRKTPKSLRIPARLTGLPVLYDARTLLLIEPRGGSQVPVIGRTDNSNTQFALLALWAARRYDVPAARSLNLLTRRFLTSQNGDGSWGYRYLFGGGVPERPAMTCVGLLGLAVGYGLAHEAGAAPPGFVQDPRIVQGFAALNKNLGAPTGRMHDHTMQNLYFLWSVERVGVLYNLTTIGNKDWYRWGAEILVANQQPDGNWAGGGYHGADPTIDTCLALLFLKRVNLATDLTGRLPFNAAQLQESITESLMPRPPPPVQETDKGKERDRAKSGAFAQKAPETLDPIAPPPTPRSPVTATERASAKPTPGANQGEQPQAAVQGGSGWWVWLLILLALLLVIVGAVLVVLHRREDEEKATKRAPRRGKGRKTRKAASG